MKLIKVDDIYTLMDGEKMIASSDSDFQTDYEVMKLSKQNCDEIFGVVDVETLSDEYSHDSIWFNKRGAYNDQEFFEFIAKKSFTDGFNKAIELNKDKLFTVDDLYRAFLINSAGNNTTLRNFFEQTVLPMFEQPKEIEVDIIYDRDCYSSSGRCDKSTMANCIMCTPVTYLKDENGCIILTKKK